MKDMWKSGIMGVIVGDALGAPVQFETREEVARHPVKGMIGYRTFNLPEGTWTDDSSLTLALLHSLSLYNSVNLKDIANNFVEWFEHGKFTPYGFSFDIGRGTAEAIANYERTHDPNTCGGRSESNNGNGSIMRIMPVVLLYIAHGIADSFAITPIHKVSALTHAHLRAKIACGLYYFMANDVVKGKGSLIDRLQSGIDHGFGFYEKNQENTPELNHYNRLRDLVKFAEVPENKIASSGYVVHTLEAAVWGLITTNSFEEALLKIVNLGGDTDSIAAVAGGLAGLYYGYDAIPAEWLAVIKRREWIEDMIKRMEAQPTC